MAVKIVALWSTVGAARLPFLVGRTDRDEVIAITGS
jgi:hypothetical protein